MELSHPPKKTVVRIMLVLTTAALLYLAYLFAFSGTFRSDDERLIVDAANSLVLQRSNYTNQTINVWGLRPIDTELAQPLLVAPLYWGAYHIPFTGNIHIIFLFNIFVTILTAIVLFCFALELGYTDQTAVAGALLFGLTTIAWPYAETFFREPLAGLMLLASAFCLDKWRRVFVAGEHGHWKWLVISTIVGVVALLSKEALLIALPALAAFAYPGISSFKKHWRTLAVVGVGVIIILVAGGTLLVTLREQIGLSASRYRVISQLSVLVQGLPGAWEGFAGFLVSPGKGIWWYSPILFLAFGAPLVLPRSRWRESWLPLALMAWFAFVYAAIKGSGWTGGSGWGPRFMVPLTPILMLAALPLINRMLNSTRFWPKIVLLGLSLFGLLIQIGGTYVDLNSYYGQIEAGTSHFVWEGPAIWTFRWSQAFGSLLFMPQAKTDILWLLPSPNWLMIVSLFLGLIVLAGAVIWLLRAPDLALRVQASIAIVSLLIVAAITVMALRFAYDDPRYQHNIPELESLQAYLAQNASSKDIVMLSTPTYSPYFLNWYKGKPIWYNLPYSPGERGSWEQQPEVVSDKVEDLISPISVDVFRGVLPRGALHRGGPLWLVVDSGPFQPWATRPPEWYLAKHTYIVGITEFSPTVRLVEYLPLKAPEASTEPARAANSRFGETIRLLGYDINSNSNSDTLNRGDQLGLSLLWEATAPVPNDYTVGVYLLDPSGVVALQQDRWPVDGFAPTSQWKEGEPIRDNYGFIIPQTAAPGQYQIAIAIYDLSSLERFTVIGADNVEQGDLLILDTLSIR
jgi:hypothetical protein